jgi:predicted dehydrogenase
MAFQPTNSFIGEVADFVQATQQQRVPCATLMDGLRNVYIMETARESPLQRPL